MAVFYAFTILVFCRHITILSRDTDYRRGFGLVIGFIGQFNALFVTIRITNTQRLVFSVAVFVALAATSHQLPTLLTVVTRLSRNQVEVLPADRLTDSQSVSLCVMPHLEPKTRFLLLSDSYGFVHLAPSLMGGRVCRLQLLLALASVVIFIAYEN
jgi:hypothetical protein